MLNFYQHIPEHISPIAFSIGSFSVRWYSLAYLAGFLVVYWLLVYRIKKECHSGLDPESMELIACKSFESVDSCFRRNDKKKEIQNLILDFLLYSFIGLLIGTRLGYALFYNFSYFSHNPLAIISPFSFDGNFVGIFGMSYFGGLFGVVIATVIFCKVKGVNFWKWSDFVIPAIPAGYFFGRI